MKKIFLSFIAIILACMFMCSLVGCDNNEAEKPNLGNENTNVAPVLSNVNLLNSNKKMNAYIPIVDSDSKDESQQPFKNAINIDNKYHYYYFYLGVISEVPIYHSTYIKYTGINFGLGFEFQRLKSETLKENISQATEVIDTHSYTGGFEVDLNQTINFAVVKASFSESTDHHWTNNWGSTITNSINTETALLEQYSETVTLTFNISEEAGLKKGYYYRVAYYSPVYAFGVIVYDVEAHQYVATSDVVVSDTTGLMVEESETALFLYDKSNKIIFDADTAIEYAKAHPLEHYESPDIDDSTTVVTPPLDLGNNLLYSGGFGTEEQPYLISNETQFANIKYYEDKNFRIIADFVVKNSNFALSDFYGVLNGDSHILTFSGSRKVDFVRIGDGQYGGIVDNNYGTIENLTIENFDYQSKESYHNGTFKIAMGGVTGINHESAIISNVKVINGNFVCDRNNSAFGSICGINNGTIKNCTVESTEIYATGDGGGVVGYLENGTVINCTFNGTIGIYIANDNGGETLRSWGGIVGYSNNAKINGCNVDEITFNYHGENSIYHRVFIFHGNCNLQIRVGVICGMFVESQSGEFSNCTFNTTNCPLKINCLGGNFHYGGHEKAYLFAQLNGMIGRKS